MAKMDTLPDQNGLKTLPFRTLHTYKAHITEYPSSPGFQRALHMAVSFEAFM